MTFVDYLNLYWHSWLLEAAMLIVLGAIILFSWKKIARLATSHMVIAAFIIWLCGLVLYSIGFAYEGSGRTLIAFLSRSALASLEMFISNNELIEVSPYYKEDGLYMACFSIVHLSAVCLSAIVILNTLGFRAKHYFLIWAESIRSSRKDKETFIFWGINNPSTTLAADICARKPNARIIFVRQMSGMSMGERLEVSQMVGATEAAARQVTITRSIDSIDNAMVLFTSLDLAGCLKSKRMLRMLKSTTEINLFLFGKEEKDNLKNAITIYDDPGKLDNGSRNIHIYTRVNLGGHNRSLQDHIALGRSQGKRIEWTFVDQSFLAVSAIKRRADYHPVNCIPSDAIHNGAVDTSFCAMILGFGETGQELYKFVNEYSSFCTSDGKPTPKRIIIVDKDINRATGKMCITSPGIFHTDSVKLINESVGTTSFWRSIREYASSINCIGVTLGDDDLGVAAVADIYKAILQYSKSRPENVKIFLRLNSQENEDGIMRFAGDLNTHKEDTGIELIPFGSVTDTYSYEAIMEKDILKEARRFNYHIGLARNLNDGIDEIQAWKRDYDMLKHLDVFKAPHLAVEEITRKVLQCHSSALFIGTLLKLAGISPSDRERLEAAVELGKSRSLDSHTYTKATPEVQAMMDILARSTFERIVTLYWLMGYRESDAKAVAQNPMESARQKLTPYVKAWHHADREAKILAYALVDTSFAIALERCDS